MTRLETLVREFVTLTAGRVDTRAHGKLALAAANKNMTAAWPRVRAIAAGIVSVSEAGFSADEKRRLGELMTDIESEWQKR